jgi:opacity protein-like surface antigen
MKRNHLALVFAAIVCVAGFAANANASMVGTMELNLGYVKSSNEVTPTNDSMGGGLGFGAAYWRSASPSVSWGAEVSYDNLGTANYDNGLTTDNEIKSNVFRVEPGVRFNFGSPVGPSFFAQGGAGYYNVSMKIDDSVSGTADDSQGKFGYMLGAGVGFPVGPKTKMNLQGQYHSVSTEGESLNYLAFRAGVGFSL